MIQHQIIALTNYQNVLMKPYWKRQELSMKENKDSMKTLFLN